MPLEVPTYYSIAETDWVPRLYDRWRAWAILGARFYEILASFVRRLYECERFGASFSSCPPSKYAAPSKYCKLLGGVVSGALSPGTLPSNPFSSRWLEIGLRNFQARDLGLETSRNFQKLPRESFHI